METTKSQMRIGARALTQKQAERLLSGFSKISGQIAEFRLQAKSYNARSIHDSEFDNQFVNTVSIFGGRGSGKTSVLLTLKYNLQHRSQNGDFMLPLIVPDQISEPNDTLGWILSFLKEEMRKFEDERTETSARAGKQGFPLCMKEEPSKLHELFDKVYRKYLFRSKEYHSIIQRRDEGFAEFKQDNLDIITSDHQLISSFRIFIDELVAQKRLASKVEEEPLLFIFFDDVDISAHRCPEVLDTIRIYLSHPNIVVFVSGDYKEFSEAMTLEFLRKDQIQDLDLDESFVSVTASERMRSYGSTRSSSRSENVLEIRKSRSQEYLKKVFPPAFRFQMMPISNKAKAEFSYEVPDQPDEGSPSMKEMLSSIEFEGCNSTEVTAAPLFDEYENVYFRAFDSNPRGLINPYYYVHQRLYVKWSLDDLQRLLDIMIASSNLLQEYETDIRNFIVFDEKRVDYKRLDSFFDRLWARDYLEEADKENRSGQMYDLVTLFSLASLFDRLLCKLNGTAYKDRGDNLLRFLNSQNKWLFPQEKQTGKLIELFDRLTENIPLPELNKLFGVSEEHLPLYWEERYFEELSDFYLEHLSDMDLQLLPTTTDNNTLRMFEYMAYQDSRWLEKHIEYIVRTGRDMHDMLRVFQKEMVNDLSNHFEHIKLEIIEWSFETTDELYQRIVQDIEGRTDNHTASDDSVQEWRHFYAALYRFVVERSRQEQTRQEKKLQEQKEQNYIAEEDEDYELMLFLNPPNTEQTEINLEYLRKNIEGLTGKSEYKEDEPLLTVEKLLETFFRLEMRVYTKQLKRILQLRSDTPVSIAAKLLGALDVIFSSCKSKFTQYNGEIIIDEDIQDALFLIKALPFHGDFDDLCDEMLNEERMNYTEYKDKVSKIRESVQDVIQNRLRSESNRAMVYRKLVMLESKIPVFSEKAFDYESQFMRQAYTNIFVTLMPLYTHLKTYVYFTETEQNEAIRYFRDMMRAMIEYMEHNRYANRTLFVQLMDSILQRESQTYALD